MSQPRHPALSKSRFPSFVLRIGPDQLIFIGNLGGSDTDPDKYEFQPLYGMLYIQREREPRKSKNEL